MISAWGVALCSHAEGAVAVPIPGFDWNAAQVTGNAAQVRVERRVTIRIPGIRSSQAQPLADFQHQAPVSRRTVEKKADSCIRTDDISGVQIVAASDSLIVHMRNSRILRAYLAAPCHARHFYSGFYVAREKDGKICAGRDELLSRSGARCRVTKFRKLVAENE